MTFYYALQHPLLDAVGAALLHSLWQGALVALGLYGALRLFEASDAHVRYAFCTAALVLMVLLPISTGIQVYVVGAAPVDRAATVADSGVVFGDALPAEASTRSDSVSAAEKTTEDADRFDRAAIPWRSVIAGFWLLTVLLLASRWLRGALAVRTLKAGSEPINDQSIEALFSGLLEKMGITKPVRLHLSTVIDQPMLVGWLKPVVLLPFSILTNLHPDHLEALLAHELAHVRRNDFLVLHLQTLVETLFFYHPAAWWVSRQMRIEREFCCDDEASRVIDNNVVYVSALAGLERMRVEQTRHALGAGNGRLVDRIRRIAEQNGAGRTRQTRFSWSGPALVVACCSMLAGACFKPSVDAMEGTPEELLTAAVEKAKQRNYVSAQRLAERAANEGSVCANLFLTELLWPDRGRIWHKDGSKTQGISWAGQDKEASETWARAFKRALEAEAWAGDSRAMLKMYFISRENNFIARIAGESDSLAYEWLDRARETNDPYAWRVYGGYIGRNGDYEGAWRALEKAIELGDESAYETWSTIDSTPETGLDPHHFFEIASRAVDANATGVRQWVGRTLEALDAQVARGNEHAAFWKSIADSFHLAERIELLPDSGFVRDIDLVIPCQFDTSWIWPVPSQAEDDG